MQANKIGTMCHLLKEIEQEHPDTKGKVAEILSILFISDRPLTEAEKAYGASLDATMNSTKKGL